MIWVLGCLALACFGWAATMALLVRAMGAAEQLRRSRGTDAASADEDGEVTRMATEAQIKAQAKYDAENTRHVHLKLNRRTDGDVLEKLDSVPSKQGYIKELIRADLAKG